MHENEADILQTDMEYLKRDVSELRTDLKVMSKQFTDLLIEWRDISSSVRRAVINSDWIEANKKSIEAAMETAIWLSGKKESIQRAMTMAEKSDQWIQRNSGVIAGILFVINIILLVVK